MITAPYDRTWQKILAFKPLHIASMSLIALYHILHPTKLYSLSRQAIGVWGIAKTLQTFILKEV
ncbi:MAG TPA: YqjK-like family protein [Arsenophonus sp.]